MVSHRQLSSFLKNWNTKGFCCSNCCKWLSFFHDYRVFCLCSVVDTGAKSFCTQESRMPMSISSLVSICQNLCIWLWRLNRLNSVYCPWSWALHGLYNCDKRALIPASIAEWQGFGIPFLMVIAFPASAYLAEKDGLAFAAEQFLLNSSSQESLL